MRKYLIWAVVLIVVFLLGYVPQAVKSAHLDSELKEASARNQEADLRDLAALAYIQAAQKNFGLASQTAGQFFSRVQELAGKAMGTPKKKDYDEIFTFHDKVIAELARGDSAAIGDLQTVYLKTRAATTP